MTQVQQINLYIAGLFGGPSDFDPGSGEDIHHSLGQSFFLSKFNTDGPISGQEHGEAMQSMMHSPSLTWAIIMFP